MHARLKFKLIKSAPKPKPGAWTMLPPPVCALETRDIMRAQSILSGPLLGQCPPLSLEQARDVLAWAGVR